MTNRRSVIVKGREGIFMLDIVHILLSNTYSKSSKDRWISIHYLDIWNMDVEWPLASAYVLCFY